MRRITVVVLISAVAVAAAPTDAPRLLGFLNRTIAWYERLDAQAALADQPTDVLYVNDNRQLARQVVTLSFDAAKALGPTLAPSSAPPPGTPQMQKLAARATSTAEVLKREQTRLQELQARSSSAAAVAEAQSRVAMAQARSDAINGIAAFAGTPSGNDVMSQIAALEQTVPLTTATPPTPAKKAPPATVIGLISDCIALNHKSSALEDAGRAADALQGDGRNLTAPIRAQLSQLREQTDAIMNAPDTDDAAELQRRKTVLDASTQQFRQLTAAMVPLAKRRILLDSYKGNLTRWRSSVLDQYHDELRRLIVRAIVFGILIFLVAAISIVWRRMTFRYIHDVKRRHHFLLIRRIVILVLVATILTATFASDFSSLTTFVGLLTAGIAIALQDVILSMAGYFVIIGKYGIRTGDRVRIAAVTGDVLDVGLVWIYLMELETRGSDQLPTGRIVELPNSVVFDHTAGIFKQLPGTRFLWHEVSLVVPSSSDFRATQERMLAAVESVFNEYRETIDRQHHDMDRLLAIATPPPRPHSRLRVATADGIEIRVRYPVEIRNAGETDDRIAAAVTEATRPAPALRAFVTPSVSEGAGGAGGARR